MYVSMNRVSIGSDNDLVPNLNQYRVIVNWAVKTKFREFFYENTKIFIHENASENIVYENCGHFVQGEMS